MKYNRYHNAKERFMTNVKFWESLKEGDILSIEEKKDKIEECSFSLSPTGMGSRLHYFYFESQVSSFGKYFNKPCFAFERHIFLVTSSIHNNLKTINMVNCSNMNEYYLHERSDVFNEIHLFRVFVNGKEYSWDE